MPTKKARKTAPQANLEPVVNFGDDLPLLLDIHDCEELFGVSRQYIGSLLRRKLFPEPDMRMLRTYRWRRDTVLDFIKGGGVHQPEPASTERA